MATKDYLHPKWQKKRLEILERDNFTCTKCGEKENTLHVHHRFYIKGNKIWDYDNNSLTTLCDNCHKTEHEYWDDKEYRSEFRESIFSCNINRDDIPEALWIYNFTKNPKDAEVLVGLLVYLFDSQSYNGETKKDFLNILKKRNDKLNRKSISLTIRECEDMGYGD